MLYYVNNTYYCWVDFTHHKHRNNSVTTGTASVHEHIAWQHPQHTDSHLARVHFSILALVKLCCDVWKNLCRCSDIGACSLFLVEFLLRPADDCSDDSYEEWWCVITFGTIVSLLLLPLCSPLSLPVCFQWRMGNTATSPCSATCWSGERCIMNLNSGTHPILKILWWMAVFIKHEKISFPWHISFLVKIQYAV